MIDPLLCFQRLTTTMKLLDNLEFTFKHELCNYPLLPLIPLRLLLKADKLPNTEAVWKVFKSRVTMKI